MANVQRLSDDQLYEQLFPTIHQSNPKASYVSDWQNVHLELLKKVVTLRLLWTEYLERHPQGYGYSLFCQLYRDWTRKVQPTIRLNDKTGEKMFVD